MENINEIRHRIRSILETRQITSSMKLISAARMKKARKQLDQTLPFFGRVRSTTADILLRSGSLKSRYIEGGGGAEPSKDRAAMRKGYLIITGDKGLAGSYNHTVLKAAGEVLSAEVNPLLFVVGRNGQYYFSRKDFDLYSGFEYPVHDPTVYRAREIAEILIEQYNSGSLGEIYMIFTMVRTGLVMEPHIIKLLPLNLEILCREAGTEVKTGIVKAAGTAEGAEAAFDGAEPATGAAAATGTHPAVSEPVIRYEPSPQVVFDMMIPKYIKGVIYGALVESFTCEQQSRMMAMESATANADEMIARLRLEYNRARQASITQEISEIIGGAEVLLKHE